MLTKQRPLFFLVPFLFAVSTKVLAQRVQPLREVLLVAEKKFNVSFTYADELVEEVKVNPPTKKSSLDGTLDTLKKQTGYLFQRIGSRYIVITKPLEKPRSILCATVLSSETGEPVAGATVQAGNEFVITNGAGYFQLPMQEITIHIRSLGFDPLILSAKDFATDCTPIFMKVSYTNLEEVTINDVIATGMEEKVDGSISIKPELVGILPGLPQPDALQALQYLPSVKSVAEAAADINIRGGTNDQNLVLLDGIKVYQTGHFFGLISGLNPHILSKVNLTRNGTSAYYGEGTSGTISMQTKEELSTKISGGGGVNLLYADGYLNVPIAQKASIQLAARGSLPSAWQTPTYKQYFNRAFSNSEVNESNPAVRNQDFYFFDTNVKFIFDATQRDKIRATFFNVSNRLEYEEIAQGISGTEQKQSSLEQQSLGASVNYSRLWNDKLKTTMEGYISGYSLDAINNNIPIDQQLTQGNEVLETGIRLSALIQVKTNFYLQTGYQFIETGITNSDRVNNPEFSRTIKEVNRTNSLFVEGNYSWNEERTQFRMGIRGSNFSKLNTTTFEPRIVFNQKLANDFSARILGEIKTQTSVQAIDLQSDFLGVEKRRWLMSNGGDVPMLKSRQVSAGVSFDKEGLLVSVDAFYKKVNGILTSSQGFQNQFQYVRATGAYDIIGLDVLMKQKLNVLDLWLGYSFSESLYEFTELIPPAFPNNLDIRHSLNGGVSARIYQFELSAGANWHTGRPTTNPVSGNEITAGNINYESPNSSRLKDYFRIDLSARWYFYVGSRFRSQAGFSLWNVFNRENVLSQYYQINTTNQAGAVQQLGLAFTPNVFIRAAFN